MDEQNKPDDNQTAANPSTQTESMNQTVAGQAASPTVVTSGNGVASASKKKLFGRFGAIPVAIIAAIAILGGSAAAYLGIVVPNKPENVLKAAFENTAKQSNLSFDGVIKLESTKENADIKAANITLKGQSDTVNKAFQTEMELTFSGVTLPVEVRKVDTNLFVKPGDLSTLRSLANSAAPAYAGIIDALNDKLSNQWIEVDETLLKQADLDCALNTSLTLSEEDINMLKSSYEKTPFVTVGSTTSDTVNGRSTYKYELKLDNDKTNEFAKSIKDLPVLKKFEACSEETEDMDTDEIADGKTTPITIWVDKSSKTLSKIAFSSTEEQEKESDMKAALEMTFSYGEVRIEKPESARPAMEVFAELQALMMGGLDTGAAEVNGLFDIQESEVQGN